MYEICDHLSYEHLTIPYFKTTPMPSQNPPILLKNESPDKTQ